MTLRLSTVSPVNMMVSVIQYYNNEAAKTDADRLLLVVINAATGFHTASSKALVLGLGERKRRDKTEVYYIRVSIPFYCCESF